MSTAPPTGRPPGIAHQLGPWTTTATNGQGLAVAVSSRAAGNVSLVVGGGDPVAQRERLLAAVGCPLDRGVAMEQVHGGAVAVVGADDAGRGMRRHADAVPGVDALVTFAPGVALMVMVADCVPVLLHAPGVGVAAVHAGRGGVLAGIVGAAVGALGVEPVRIEALIGPAIGGCCYEVPPDMAADLEHRLPGTAGRTSWGTASVDLPAAVRAQLAHAGVEAVVEAGSCTRCGTDRWFSHRAHPGAGRQAAVVVRHQRPPVTGPVEGLRVRPAASPQRLTGSTTVGS